MSVEPTAGACKFLKTFVPVAEAIGKLFYPHAEIVIHDLTSDTIFHMVNNFSHRAVGNPSMFGDMPGLNHSSGVLGPYEKANWNGEQLKSITALLTDTAGRHIGMLCINLAVSKFHAAAKLLESFMLQEHNERPYSIFAYDWRDEINLCLQSFLKERNKILSDLTRGERVAFVGVLSKRGLFQARNAVSYIADQLDVTKATVYNYLNDASKSRNLTTTTLRIGRKTKSKR